RFSATGGARFKQHSICNLARPAEALLVREPVVSPESADRLGLVVNECQRGVRADGVTEFLEFPIDAVFPEWRLECARIQEDVDVFRKPLDHVPTFRQTGTALEEDGAVVVGDSGRGGSDGGDG